MKKLLNTLYVSTQGTYLHQEGETLVAELNREVKMRLPIHTLSGIVCFGNVLCSPFLLGLCGERGVHVSFLTEHGRFLSRVIGPVSGNVLLRREQFRAADDPTRSCAIARSVVQGKIANSRGVLQRRLRPRQHPASHPVGGERRCSARTGRGGGLPLLWGFRQPGRVAEAGLRHDGAFPQTAARSRQYADLVSLHAFGA